MELFKDLDDELGFPFDLNEPVDESCFVTANDDDDDDVINCFPEDDGVIFGSFEIFEVPARVLFNSNFRVSVFELDNSSSVAS